MKRIQDPFPPTPVGFHLRVEQTLCELEEENMTKRKFSVSLAIALALTLITATAFAASAVLSGGYVNSYGEYTPYTESEQVPDDPSTWPGTQYDHLFSDIPRGETWRVEQDGQPVHGAGGTRPLLFTPANADLSALMAGSPLPLPRLPEGAELLSLQIAGALEPEPYRTSMLPDGATLAKYRQIQPQGASIDNYYSEIRLNGNTVYIDMSVNTPVTGDTANYLGTYVSGSGDYRSMMIAGWEAALYIDEGNGVRMLNAWTSLEGGKIVYCSAHFPQEFDPETIVSMLNCF